MDFKTFFMNLADQNEDKYHELLRFSKQVISNTLKEKIVIISGPGNTTLINMLRQYISSCNYVILNDSDFKIQDYRNVTNENLTVDDKVKLIHTNAKEHCEIQFNDELRQFILSYDKLNYPSEIEELIIDYQPDPREIYYHNICNGYLDLSDRQLTVEEFNRILLMVHDHQSLFSGAQVVDFVDSFVGDDKITKEMIPQKLLDSINFVFED